MDRQKTVWTRWSWKGRYRHTMIMIVTLKVVVRLGMMVTLVVVVRLGMMVTLVVVVRLGMMVTLVVVVRLGMTVTLDRHTGGRTDRQKTVCTRWSWKSTDERIYRQTDGRTDGRTDRQHTVQADRPIFTCLPACLPAKCGLWFYFLGVKWKTWNSKSRDSLNK